MVFDIKNKVALITGGASGLGFNYAQELLRNGTKGVALADINPELGEKALQEIEKEFGAGKAIFIQLDITSFEQFEAAFEKTIKHFKNLDIVVNNAGVCNDAIWEKEIQINVNGTIHGSYLAFEKYLPKYKSGEEAVIVNASSTAGVSGYSNMPVYSCTKHGIIGLVRSWGIPDFYEETKVRIIAICPGGTLTPLTFQIHGNNFGDRYQRYLEKYQKTWSFQEPEFVAKEVIEVIKYAPNGTSWIIEGNEPSFEYKFPDRETMKNNLLPKNK